eukprot:351682-Chlamydomonas_euryale.AAC.2
MRPQGSAKDDRLRLHLRDLAQAASVSVARARLPALPRTCTGALRSHLPLAAAWSSLPCSQASYGAPGHAPPLLPAPASPLGGGSGCGGPCGASDRPLVKRAAARRSVGLPPRRAWAPAVALSIRGPGRDALTALLAAVEAALTQQLGRSAPAAAAAVARSRRLHCCAPGCCTSTSSCCRCRTRDSRPAEPPSRRDGAPAAPPNSSARAWQAGGKRRTDAAADGAAERPTPPSAPTSRRAMGPCMAAAWASLASTAPRRRRQRGRAWSRGGQGTGDEGYLPLSPETVQRAADAR